MTTTKEPASTATGKLSLAEILAVFFGGATESLRFTAYDGSSAGVDDAASGDGPADSPWNDLSGHRAR